MTVGAIGGFGAYTYNQTGLYGPGNEARPIEQINVGNQNAQTGITNQSGHTGNVGVSDINNSGIDGESGKKANGKSSPADCETCRERKYVDGSNDMNVSFKSAAHVSPNAASAAVRAHEGQHVTNAYNRAAQNNGSVVSANVAIHTAVCPECGRTYVSGGTTTTQIKYNNESNPYQQNFKSADAARYIGINLDLTT